MRTLSILLLSAPAAFAQTSITQVPLNYNFNGMVHANEAGQPDDPNGYRSISDRALNFSGGVPGDALLDKYIIVNQAQALDIVHLGNRNTVSVPRKRYVCIVELETLSLLALQACGKGTSLKENSDGMR